MSVHRQATHANVIHSNTNRTQNAVRHSDWCMLFPVTDNGVQFSNTQDFVVSRDQSTALDKGTVTVNRPIAIAMLFAEMKRKKRSKVMSRLRFIHK